MISQTKGKLGEAMLVRVMYNSPIGAFSRVGPLTFSELQDFRSHHALMIKALRLHVLRF